MHCQTYEIDFFVAIKFIAWIMTGGLSLMFSIISIQGKAHFHLTDCVFLPNAGSFLCRLIFMICYEYQPLVLVFSKNGFVAFSPALVADALKIAYVCKMLFCYDLLRFITIATIYNLRFSCVFCLFSNQTVSFYFSISLLFRFPLIYNFSKSRLCYFNINRQRCHFKATNCQNFILSQVSSTYFQYFFHCTHDVKGTRIVSFHTVHLRGGTLDIS